MFIDARRWSMFRFYVSLSGDGLFRGKAVFCLFPAFLS
ncbi:hypothetical protein TREAZ_3474 [Leadbettera azotonutricia ZAS-9]|uniref:Uncharacterized protein n=1 Tax=Leadbettera azotonutricia (strain ATCC BAA-888 / DSM 13862 / ZAS-9) TaxID=545695 RepID=F5Y7F8_LEAAZ|nr:hypothetical protein TREAZ_3474 [Leadbettera azotonutricia ZAS-9]